MTGRDAEREQLTDALQFVDGQDEIVSLLLPVVDRIANERAAAALEAVADNVRKQAPGYIGRIDTADSIAELADALDPS